MGFRIVREAQLLNVFCALTEYSNSLNLMDQNNAAGTNLEVLKLLT
jgi:hypothetical protein